MGKEHERLATVVDFYAGNAAGMDAFVRFPCPGNNGQLCLRMALTVETNAASEAMHALGVHLDGEEQRTLDAMIALLNAAEVRIQLGLTGEQLRVSLVMSEIEPFISRRMCIRVRDMLRPILCRA